MKKQQRSPYGNPRSKPYGGGKRTPGFKSKSSPNSERRDSETRFSEKKPFEKRDFRKTRSSESYRPERPDADKRGFKKRDSGKRGFDNQGSEKRDFRKPRSAEGYRPERPAADKRGFEKRDSGKRSFDKRGTEKRIPEKRAPQKRTFEKRAAEKPIHIPAHTPTRNADTVLIWGFHAVRAAWLNPKRKCFRLWLSESGQKTFEETLEKGREELLKRPDAKHTDRNELDRITPPGSVHQGIILEAGPLHEPSLHDLISGDNPPDCLVMLDQVTDPHNIGAILRSAAALGAGGVILTERNAPGMTGVLAKSASGAADHIPQVHVVNLSRALDELREAGYWSVGLAEEGEKNIDACDLSGRTVLVLGAEGEGLRQLTRKKCDELARLPTGGAIGSLNVSNAAAVALYEAKRQKTKS